MYITQIILIITSISSPKVQFEPVHKSLIFDEPMQVLFNGIENDTMYVVEKKGVVQAANMNRETKKKSVFLDIEDRVGSKHDEEGLLSLVFHPNYKENGELYVWYTAQKPRRGVLSKFTKEVDETTIKSSSEEIVLEVPQPWGNHNGGTVLFGPDGYLYLGIGDGGAANDPYNNGQNKNTLLGTVIRIDVNSSVLESDSTKQSPYIIPPDNPLVGQKDAREEIWSWGLRNPWRMSFDRETGMLWTGDVGQNSWEEIDILEAGKNYGWNVREGLHDFHNDDPKDPEMVDPVHEYGRRKGGSITGGYVYRGTKIPDLVGSYLYGDYLSERIWSLSQNEDGTYTETQIAKKTPLAISSFSETPSGEILVCGFPNAYASKGKIYLLVPSSSTTSSIR